MSEPCAIVGVGQTHHKSRRHDVSYGGLVREAVFRDVHVGHDLDPGRHGVLEFHGEVHALVKDAVDPVPDAERPLVGFDMDVACPLPDALDEDVVDQGDDGRFV